MNHLRLRYAGSIFWLVFWLILFFPVAIALLFLNGTLEIDGKRYFMRYEGSRGWICFWIIAFLPVAIVLLLINGVSLHAGEGGGITTISQT